MNLNLNLLLFFLFVVLNFRAVGQVNVLNAERPEEIGVLSENQEEILPTIVSRCQIVNLRPIESSALTDVIEKKTNNPEVLVAKAQGNFNDLLNLINSDKDKEFEGLLIEGLRKAFKVKENKKLIVDLMDWSTSLCGFGKEEQKTFLEFGECRLYHSQF